MKNSEVATVVAYEGVLLAILKDGRVFHGQVVGRVSEIQWKDVSSPIPGTDAGNPQRASTG